MGHNLARDGFGSIDLVPTVAEPMTGVEQSSTRSPAEESLFVRDLGPNSSHSPSFVQDEQQDIHTSETASGQSSHEDLVIPSRVQSTVSVLIPARPKFVPLPISSSRSGLVYDVKMRYHQSLEDEDDDPHPERPLRISKIFEELKAAGLVEDTQDPSPSSEFQLLRIPARQATNEQLCLVHSENHVNKMESTACECPMLV